MRFGISYANILQYGQPDQAAALGQAAEAVGIDSLWVVEHVLVPADYESSYPYRADGRMPGGDDFGFPDPLVWLAYVAAHTETLLLATGILVLPQRSPAIVAKEVATLDVLSGGRAVLGVGAGWLAEEFAALGVPFERRGARLEAYIEAIRALWGEGPATVHNEFVDLDRAWSRPRPPRGSVPIVIGGHSAPAARRAGRLGDGFFPATGDVTDLVGIARAAAVEAGRDPAELEITAGISRRTDAKAMDRLRLLADLGVARAVFPVPPDLDELARYADEVMSAVP